MILIAGDSWSTGCYTVQKDLYHRGIEQLLHNDGHRVINLSQGGFDLASTCQTVRDFLLFLPSTPSCSAPGAESGGTCDKKSRPQNRFLYKKNSGFWGGSPRG